MFVPESYNWIVAPTYKLGEKEFRVIYKDFEKLEMLKYCRKAYSVKQGDMRIQTPWNSVLEVVSAEKQDSLLGEGLSHAIMSESARHDRSTWEQYIEPALSDLRGSADFPSTPVGYNWYHGLWMLGQENNKNYKSWNFPTWDNIVRYPGGYKDPELLRIRMRVSKKYWDQEYGALFTSFSGAIYDEWDDKVHVRPHQYNPNWPNYLAFDYGFANPFVCLDVQVDPSDNVYVWREYHVRNLSTFEHGHALMNRENPPGYHVDGMWGDPRGADEAATLAAMGFGYVAFEDVPWKHGVEAIKRLLKIGADGFPKLTVDPSCVNTRRVLSQLHVKPPSRQQRMDLQENTGDGNIQHKVDDHEADALRYLIGALFVAGANSHLSDIYDQSYAGSESEDFFKLHSGVVLDTTIGY